MENLDKNLEEFQGKIRYYFNDKELLIEALSHSSYANEKRKGRNSNERLEFLGDSVLSIVVSQYLFEHFTHLPEGELTKIRASLVCEKSLYEFAKQIDLGEHILLGKGEENTGGRERVSILADAFEAVIAAVFLDGGLEAAKRHILSLFLRILMTENQYLSVIIKRFCRKLFRKILRKKLSISL